VPEEASRQFFGETDVLRTETYIPQAGLQMTLLYPQIAGPTELELSPFGLQAWEK
jgi:hypothetical protein